MACTFCSIWSGSQRKHAAAECVTTRLLGGRTAEVSFRALVGCCHNRIHPGKLTRKLMGAHDCLGKECRFFEKYEDADYWREKNRKAAAKKKHRQKQTLEKAQQRREADALTLKDLFQTYADGAGYVLRIVRVQEEKKGLLKVFYVSENMKPFRKRLMEPLEHLLELGGIRKDITLLVLSGIAVVLSLAGVQPLPFDIAWAAIILCGVPIILEAIIGLVTEFDIKADVLVSLALIAGQLGIREVRANCLPQDKLRCIDEFQQKGEPVCMIGDGINDAPALKKAEVGIAMGGTGSDIAVDAADIALVDDEVKELPHLMALSQRMMTTIKLNLTFSMTLNFIAITLAITGILNPVVGALVHNAGSVACYHQLGIAAELEEKIMITIIGLIIGILLFGAGVYYLQQNKNDAESRKIYGVTAAIGAVVAVVCAVMLL